MAPSKVEEHVKALEVQLAHVIKRLDMIERVCHMLMDGDSNKLKKDADNRVGGAVASQPPSQLQPESSTLVKRFLRTAY